MTGAADVQAIIASTFLLLGVGFLIANARLAFQYALFVKRRRGALLTWRGPKPPYYVMQIALGVFLGTLLLYNVFRVYRGMPADWRLFGQGMMFAYYAYLFPMTRNIERGFYEDGIWAETTFIPYTEVGGVTWRESEHQATLIVISRLRNLARRLTVPGDKYAAARRLLREKVGQQTVKGTGLGLGDG